MTEAEAAKRWCPFAKSRVVDRVGGTADGRTISPVTAMFSGPASIEHTTACLASGCMAWRWEPHALEDRRSPEGYCGLAGKP